jgi:hypothetical protein
MQNQDEFKHLLKREKLLLLPQKQNATSTSGEDP